MEGRGDVNQSMKLFKEQERICRQLGKVEGLAISLASQASALRQMGSVREGLALAEEALRIATGHGYTALATKIEATLKAIREISDIPSFTRATKTRRLPVS